MFNLVALYFINFFCFRACRNFALMICTLINNYNRPLWFKGIPGNGGSQRHHGRSPFLVLKGDNLRKGASSSLPFLTAKDMVCRWTWVSCPMAAVPSLLAAGMSSKSKASSLPDSEATGLCFPHAGNISAFLYLLNIMK